MTLPQGLPEPPLTSECSRTFALYKPGVPMPDVKHSFCWTGQTMPCTGEYRCYLCGMNGLAYKALLTKLTEQLTREASA